MNLKEAIGRFGQGLIVPPPQSDPSIPLSKRVAEFELRFDKSTNLGLRERKALIQRLREAAAADDLSTFSVRDLKCTADYLFEPSERLAELPGFLRCYLAALAERGTGSALVRLLSIYCIHFDPQSPQIEEIARFLRSSLSRLPGLWRQRHEASRLLDPSKASEIVGGLLIDARAPYDALGRFGLAGRRGASGLVTHVIRHVLSNLRLRLEREASLTNVNSIIRWASIDGRSIHAQGTQAAIAEALLLPWQALQPPGPVRKRSNHPTSTGYQAGLAA